MENLEQIERYLDRQMSADEREAFENQLATTPGLQQYVKEIKAARTAIDLLHTDSIRDRLKGYEANYVKKQAQRRRYTGWAIAAVALLLLALAFILWPPSPPTRDTLYQKHLENVCQKTINRLNSQERGQGNPDQPPIRPIDQEKITMCETIAGQDPAALRAKLADWEMRIAQDDNQARELKFYMGLAYWQLGEYTQADDCFRWLIDKGGEHDVIARALMQELPQ